VTIDTFGMHRPAIVAIRRDSHFLGRLGFALIPRPIM
jgi:hypothetical protein